MTQQLEVALILLGAGIATAGLFAFDRLVVDGAWRTVLARGSMPIRRKRRETPAKLFPNDLEFRRRLTDAR